MNEAPKGYLATFDKEDPDARVLSYHDVLLRRADLDLLKGPEWLNDQVGSCTAWTQLRLAQDSMQHSS